MKRKYPLRDRLHPEVMVRGSFSSRILDTLDRGLENTRGACSGQVAQALELLGDDDTTHGQMFWALSQWRRHGKPIYHLDPGLAEALTHTDFPWETCGKLELPEEALYLALPPIFSLEHFETGEHPVEGVYLVKDLIAVRVDDEGREVWWTADQPMGVSRVITNKTAGYVYRPGISLIGIGASKGIVALVGKGGVEVLEEARDDAIITTSILEGMPLHECDYLYGGVEELLRVVVNLLYLMNNTSACERERVTPEVEVKGSRERNRRRAIDEVEKKGKSLLPYTILRLSQRAKRAEPRPGAPVRKIKYQTWVPGHFHSYWVLDPGDEKVLEKKPGKGGTLHRVSYFLTPYKMGEGLPERPRTVVVRR